MKLVEHRCPSCGGQARKQILSSKYVCMYCNNVFEIHLEKEPKEKKPDRKPNEEQTKSTVIYIMVFIFAISSLLILILSNGNNSGSTKTTSDVHSYTISNITEEKQEAYTFPKSKYGQQIASLIFEKPFDKVTAEELQMVRYLKFDSKISDQTHGFDTIIEYSYEDYKNYTDRNEFEKTIQIITIRDGNKESEFDDMDMACFSNLTYLEASHIDESVLGELKQLTALHVYGIDIEELKSSFPIQQLEELQLDESVYDKEKWKSEGCISEALKSMTSLKCLMIDYRDRTELDTVLGELTGLESLRLWNLDEINDYSVLKSLVNLKELTLEDAKEFRDLSLIRSFPKLESLSLSGSKILNYEELRNHATLKKLVLHYNSKVEDITPISTIQSLEEFDTVIYDINGLDSLAKLTGMKRISLSTNGNQSLNFLSAYENLEELTLTNCNLPDGFKMLYPLNKLKKITIHSPDEFSDFSDLMSVTGLEEVNIYGMSHHSVWMQNLMQMPSLKSLTIEGVDVHMDFNLDLSESGLEKLRLINIALYEENSWDTAGAEHVLSMLPTLKNLKELEYVGADISDLKEIAKIKTLEMLNVTDNYVSDYQPIYEMENLKIVKFGGNVSEMEKHGDIIRYTDSGHIN